MSSQSGTHPTIFQKYIDQAHPPASEMPRLVTRRFHGQEVPLWLGHVHVDDVEGYVENLRLRFFLNRWLASNPGRRPTTDDVYHIMVEADEEERRESARPFQVQRMADNIIRNGVREPIILAVGDSSDRGLWDGNRRFYGTKHIMTVDREDYADARPTAQWIPTYIYTMTGDDEADAATRQAILVECNFVNPEQIPWPNYVKAEQVHLEYKERMHDDPDDSALSRVVKGEFAKEFGLGGWRVADRWIKMYDLALQFKEYEEEENGHDSTSVDLFIQERFEYFDELSKSGVFGVLRDDPDRRDKVFGWLWDGKFKSFPDVRSVPRILADPVALKQADEPDDEAVRRAIATVIANDPVRVKDKSAANEKIKQFAAWLDSFKREEYKLVDASALDGLQTILRDVVKISSALLENEEEAVSA